MGRLSFRAWHAGGAAFKRLRYTGVDAAGNSSTTVEGFHARVVQHECDHLYGVLYPMRMKDMRQFGYRCAVPRSGYA